MFCVSVLQQNFMFVSVEGGKDGQERGANEILHERALKCEGRLGKDIFHGRNWPERVRQNFKGRGL